MNGLFNFLLIIRIFLVFGENFQKLQEKYDCPTNCVDIWSNCQQFVQLCQDPKQGAAVRAKCPCTCQICELSTSSSTETPTTTSSVDQLKCRPVNLIFALDTSEKIYDVYFNYNVKDFIKKISLGYPMKGEINEPSTRIGVVQFASQITTVTYPLFERTRQEFLDTIDRGVHWELQGLKDFPAGLDATLSEFSNHGITKNDNVMIILMTDYISELDVFLTKSAADRVHAFTQYFAGIGIDGYFGGKLGLNLTIMTEMIGNRELAFKTITDAEDPINGIWPKSRQIYPCQASTFRAGQ